MMAAFSYGIKAQSSELLNKAANEGISAALDRSDFGLGVLTQINSARAPL